MAEAQGGGLDGGLCILDVAMAAIAVADYAAGSVASAATPSDGQHIGSACAAEGSNQTVAIL